MPPIQFKWIIKNKKKILKNSLNGPSVLHTNKGQRAPLPLIDVANAAILLKVRVKRTSEIVGPLLLLQPCEDVNGPVSLPK